MEKKFKARIWSCADMMHAPLMKLDKASKDLHRAATVYQLIAKLPVDSRHIAMANCVKRPYMFERNKQRWPDGLFHLVDRDYQPWMHHTIAYTAEQLEFASVGEWQRSNAIQTALSDNYFLIVDDDMQYANPRAPNLFRLATVLENIAVFVDDAFDAMQSDLHKPEMKMAA
jgi:hypothetical protein